MLIKNKKQIIPERGKQLLEDQQHHRLKHDRLGPIKTHLNPQFYSADHHFRIEEMNQKVIEFQIAPANGKIYLY